MGFPGGASGKEATCQCRRCKGPTPGSEVSLAVGNGTSFQYCRLENSMGRGAWWATVHGATKSQIWRATKHTKKEGKPRITTRPIRNQKDSWGQVREFQGSRQRPGWESRGRERGTYLGQEGKERSWTKPRVTSEGKRREYLESHSGLHLPS